MKTHFIGQLSHSTRRQFASDRRAAVLHRSLKVAPFFAFVLALLLILIPGRVKALGPLITQADCCPVEITEPGQYTLDEQLVVRGTTAGIHIHDVSNVTVFCEFGGPFSGALQSSSVKGPDIAIETSIGILVERATAVRVDSCAVTDFFEGFGLRDASAVILQRNRAERNLNDGFDIDRSNNNIFTMNKAQENGEDGVDLDHSSVNVIEVITSSRNGANGFDVSDSNFNTFRMNTVNNNGRDQTTLSNLDKGNGFFLLRSNFNTFGDNSTMQNRRAFRQRESIANVFMFNTFAPPQQ
jgi:parallel beta-helix repeat protein